MDESGQGGWRSVEVLAGEGKGIVAAEIPNNEIRSRLLLDDALAMGGKRRGRSIRRVVFEEVGIAVGIKNQLVGRRERHKKAIRGRERHGPSAVRADGISAHQFGGRCDARNTIHVFGAAGDGSSAVREKNACNHHRPLRVEALEQEGVRTFQQVVRVGGSTGSDGDGVPGIASLH